MSTHEQVNELLAGYALGALDEDDERMVRRHVERCATCAADLKAMGAVSAVLPLSLEEVAVPASLRQSIHDLAHARRERTIITPALRLPAYRPLAWAAGALVAIGLVGWNISLQVQLGQTGAEVAQLKGQVVHATLSGATASGTVAYLGTDRVALVSLEGLTRPAEGKTYELWVIGGGVPQAAGTFLPDSDGTKALVLARQLKVGQELAVTLEPSGGSPPPTSNPLLRGKL